MEKNNNKKDFMKKKKIVAKCIINELLSRTRQSYQK